MKRCRTCGTTVPGRAGARIAWWLHLAHRDDLTHRYCSRTPPGGHTMSRALAWLASGLVVLGVALMIRAQDNIVIWCLGIVALTFGVRTAIDAAKADGE